MFGGHDVECVLNLRKGGIVEEVFGTEHDIYVWLVPVPKLKAEVEECRHDVMKPEDLF